MFTYEAVRKLLTCVCFNVAVQGRLHCETLPTFITLVRSLSRVDPDVPEH